MSDENKTNEKLDTLATKEKDTSGLWTARHGEDLAYNQGWRLASQLAKSGLLPKALQQKPEDVFVVILHGQDFGLTATQALRSMHVIEGRPAMSAELIVGLVKRRPDRCKYFTLIESTDKVATYETLEVGAPAPTRLSYTLEQAQAAGLAGKDNWRKHPAAMLRARAGKGLAVAVYADITAGLLEEDEADEIQRQAWEARKVPPSTVAPDWAHVAPRIVDGAGVNLTQEDWKKLRDGASRMPIVAAPGMVAGAGRIADVETQDRTRQAFRVIDVAPGETEEEAAKRAAATPAEPSPEDKLDAYLRECEQAPEAFDIKRYRQMMGACDAGPGPRPATDAFEARRRAIQAKAQAGGGK